MSEVNIVRGDVQASVEDRYLDEFVKDGWRLADSPPSDHEAKIASLNDKDEVESYIKEHFGVDIDKRGSLETVKEKALAVINESGRSDS